MAGDGEGDSCVHGQLDRRLVPRDRVAGLVQTLSQGAGPPADLSLGHPLPGDMLGLKDGSGSVEEEAHVLSGVRPSSGALFTSAPLSSRRLTACQCDREPAGRGPACRTAGAPQQRPGPQRRPHAPASSEVAPCLQLSMPRRRLPSSSDPCTPHSTGGLHRGKGRAV